METMKAVRFYGKDDVRIEEIEKPTPKGGEVLIKIGGAGVCHSDLHIIKDGIIGDIPPFTLGHENAGWVEAVGEGVTNYKKGDAVIVYGPWGCGHCKPCQMSSENYCDYQSVQAYGGGLGLNGGLAEYMIVPSERLLVPINDLDPVVAAPLSDAALTPYAAIKRSLNKLTTDATVVVLGIGGLGHMALQILKAVCGSFVIAGDISEEKLALAKEHGADMVVNTSDIDAAEQILKVTGIKKAAVVLDFVGINATINLAKQVVGLNGDMVIVGLGGGQVDVSSGQIPFGVNVSNPYWGSRAELIEVIALANQGKLNIELERYTLDETKEVYEKLHQGKINGRAVIVP